MNTNKLNKSILTAILLPAAITLQAQVTMGDSKEPESFSALELVSNQNTGLRMPLLTTDERNTITASVEFQSNATTFAKGLTIYNTTTDCLEFWNGEKWISTCNGEAAPVIFDPIYNVDAGTATLNLDAVFVQGSGDGLTRGTGVSYSEMAAGVFRYTGATGQAFEGTATTVKGITVTIPATTLANGAGELTISVSGTPTAATAGSAFDIPITVLGKQLYVRVHVGCGAYTGTTRTIPSTDGDPSWLQFQCFNLGADTSLDPFTYVSNGDAVDNDIKGYLFQWGRPADGHQLRSSSTTTTLATSSTPSHANFITNPTTPFDWLDGGGEDLRWGDGTTNENMAKGYNDPCPSGWKVPSQAQLANIFNREIISGIPDLATANIWTWTTNGYKVGNALFLPTTGMRQFISASLDSESVNTAGYYWNSTKSSTNSIYSLSITCFNLNNTSGVYTSVNASRANGYSVRCIAE